MKYILITDRVKSDQINICKCMHLHIFIDRFWLLEPEIFHTKYEKAS